MLVKSDPAFTLMEVLIVLSILLILTSIISPKFLSHLDKAEKIADMATAKNIAIAIEIAAMEGEVELKEGELVNLSKLSTLFNKEPKPQARTKKEFKVFCDEDGFIKVYYDKLGGEKLYPTED